MQPTPEHSNSLELLRMLRGLKAKDEKPDPGFKSTVQWGKEWGLCRSKARKYINVAVRHGLVTERTYRILDTDGRVRLIPHYKFDKPADTAP